MPEQSSTRRGVTRRQFLKTGAAAGLAAVALKRLGYGIRPVDATIVAGQQKIADTFKELGLIPTAINVSDAVRKPGS